ncbi:XAC2610-related protein [Chryseobacterium shandongense]|uniref:XAC2610-related protein n=1 Tax=Chryseobacterium shandongense TaxID=1493872 RepID=UPI000F4EED8D|nr:hypothetical protein [Chryseobacterium shandongense]AZA58862.1 hypothetical protein EG350_17485 [Chryseobacterium shandongense]
MNYIKFFFAALFIITIFYYCRKNENDDSYILDEKFVDSVHIGRESKSKVEVKKFTNLKTKDTFVLVIFYDLKKIWVESKDGYFHHWEQTHCYYFDKDGITGINAEISDFNSDGFKDFTYQSGIAGRGGNTIRKLFIYDLKSKGFIYIRNSDYYPNLSYNSDLKCINSLILTGSTTTSFLRIKGDSLDEFARVDVSDTIVVEEKDSLGKFRMIEKRKFTGDDYDFYKTFKKYKPLEY